MGTYLNILWISHVHVSLSHQFSHEFVSFKRSRTIASSFFFNFLELNKIIQNCTPLIFIENMSQDYVMERGLKFKNRENVFKLCLFPKCILLIFLKSNFQQFSPKILPDSELLLLGGLSWFLCLNLNLCSEKRCHL